MAVQVRWPPPKVMPKRILIIEDDAEQAHQIARLLSEEIRLSKSPHPASIISVRTFFEGLTKAREEHFDACLIDLCLPDSHWQRTIGMIPDLAEHVPVVTMTGRAEETQACNESLFGGADDFISKDRLARRPCDAWEALWKAAARRAYRHEQATTSTTV